MAPFTGMLRSLTRSHRSIATAAYGERDFYADAENSIERRDIEIFKIHSETSPGDRRSLLRIQSIVRNRVKNYTYLEVGSHLGGTLYPLLADRKCGFAYSIDKRPLSQPDERGVRFPYEGNSTDRMLNELKPHLPASALAKLRTHDADLSELPAAAIPVRADLAFIDAEHTNRAAFRDFLRILRFVNDNAVVVYHDAALVFDALCNVEEFLIHQRIKHKIFYLEDVIFVCFLGNFAALGEAALSAVCFEKEPRIAQWQEELWRDIAARRPAAGAPPN
jgi:hypothetical protein